MAHRNEDNKKTKNIKQKNKIKRNNLGWVYIGLSLSRSLSRPGPKSAWAKVGLGLSPSGHAPWDQGRFRFRGRQLSQEYDRKSIKISMSKFVQDMEPIAVPKHVKDDLVAPLEASVHSKFRGRVG